MGEHRPGRGGGHPADEGLLAELAEAFAPIPLAPPETTVTAVRHAVAALPAPTTVPARQPRWRHRMAVAGAGFGVLVVGTGTAFAAGVPLPPPVRALATDVGLPVTPLPVVNVQNATSTLRGQLQTKPADPPATAAAARHLANQYQQLDPTQRAQVGPSAPQLLHRACNELFPTPPSAPTRSGTSTMPTGGATGGPPGESAGSSAASARSGASASPTGGAAGTGTGSATGSSSTANSSPQSGWTGCPSSTSGSGGASGHGPSTGIPGGTGGSGGGSAPHPGTTHPSTTVPRGGSYGGSTLPSGGGHSHGPTSGPPTVGRGSAPNAPGGGGQSHGAGSPGRGGPGGGYSPHIAPSVSVHGALPGGPERTPATGATSAGSFWPVGTTGIGHSWNDGSPHEWPVGFSRP